MFLGIEAINKYYQLVDIRIFKLDFLLNFLNLNLFLFFFQIYILNEFKNEL